MKLSISNSLILISLIFTIYGTYNSDIYFYGMNDYFLQIGAYLSLFYQFVVYSFLHGGFLHFLANSLFLFFFGNPIEHELGPKKYLIFFITATIFNGIALIILSSGITVGISGFVMSILAFYTLKLKEVGNEDYKGGITAIVINVLLGLSGSISFVGHLFGALFGVVFYYLLNFIEKDE